MLRKIRIVAATICFTLITLLFLDFTGTLHLWFGWLAKIQFLPAVLALNVGVVAFLVILTLLFGRVYCSVICPLGVFQDIVSWISGKRKKNRFRYSPAILWLRYSMLALFIVALLAGFTAIAALIAPYSAYGRIASNLFAPLYQWGNNLLAYFAERIDSYAFYSTDVWLKSIPTFIIALVTFVSLLILAWKNGRAYCNTICPVGTVLGLLSRFSLFRPVIDTTKCNGCQLCARNCKASCIDAKNHHGYCGPHRSVQRIRTNRIQSVRSALSMGKQFTRLLCRAYRQLRVLFHRRVAEKHTHFYHCPRHIRLVTYISMEKRTRLLQHDLPGGYCSGAIVPILSFPPRYRHDKM